MTRSGVAGSVRRNKEAHPERYCTRAGCLWALRSGPCPKHGTRAVVADTPVTNQQHAEALARCTGSVSATVTDEAHGQPGVYYAPPAVTAAPTRWRVEVIADSSGEWCGNGLSFDTYALAEAYARDLHSRWMAVREWRVVPVVPVVADGTGAKCS